VYATGIFALMGGVAGTLNIARWDGSAWNPLSSGLNITSGRALGLGKDGLLYVGGLFTSAGGVTCSNIAKWNGTSFEPLGSGTNDLVEAIHVDDSGLVYAGGIFDTAGGLSAVGAALWNGSTWVHLDINLPGAVAVYKIFTYRDDLYLGYGDVGTAISSALNTITNGGTRTSYPVIKVKGGKTSDRIKYIHNWTTGSTLWLNYVTIGGETITLSFDPKDRYIRSSYFGDIPSALRRNSHFAAFRLAPGANRIAVYIQETIAGTKTAATIEWIPLHWSHDGAAV
jgi:hypothetical protein